MTETIQYIINFLVGENYGNYISYGFYVCNKCRVIIHPACDSPFSNNITTPVLPSLPLQSFEGVPILFGEPKIEYKENKCIIYADLIASTFFLISRYEETIVKGNRDKHGRYIGKGSLPYRAGFLHRPIVDEYGKILRDCLRNVGVEVDEPTPGFSKVYLTHDVDVPWEHFTSFGAIKRVLGEIKRKHQNFLYPILNSFGVPDFDPRYTFDTIIDIDKQLPFAHKIYFIKSGGTQTPEDSWVYISSRGFKRLLSKLKSQGADLGYHVSYEAGHNTGLILQEVKVLETVLHKRTTLSRNHYLASIHPEDSYELVEAGITDDFTMAYADVAGFRLGTSRPVCWIDPTTKELSNLVLHPLTIMECTLTESQYMGLNEKESLNYGDDLIRATALNHGEISLLLHNNDFSNCNGKIDLKNYVHFINTIKTIETNNEN